MKLFCISDLHGNLEGLDPSSCDIAVIAGDFAKMTGFGKWHLYDQKKWIEKNFIPWAQSHDNVEFVIIPGNHDLIFDKSKTFVHNDIDYSIEWPANVHMLIDNRIELKGLKFYGTPHVPIINYRWAFEVEHDKLQEHFRKIPSDLDVLITHSPPRVLDSSVDYSMQTCNGPFGSSELTEAIFEKKPKYVFCGHIHTGNHNCLEFENSKIYNVSRLDEDYQIAYEPLILDI